MYEGIFGCGQAPEYVHRSPHSQCGLQHHPRKGDDLCGFGGNGGVTAEHQALPVDLAFGENRPVRFDFLTHQVVVIQLNEVGVRSHAQAGKESHHGWRGDIGWNIAIAMALAHQCA
jgi:hypothetical protein